MNLQILLKSRNFLTTQCISSTKVLFQGVKQQTQFPQTPPAEGTMYQNTQGAIADVEC